MHVFGVLLESRTEQRVEIVASLLNRCRHAQIHRRNGAMGNL